MQTDIAKEKKSRGYRLTLSTHLLIQKLQQITLENQDEVIYNACNMYYASLNEKFHNQGGKK